MGPRSGGHLEPRETRKGTEGAWPPFRVLPRFPRLNPKDGSAVGAARPPVKSVKSVIPKTESGRLGGLSFASQPRFSRTVSRRVYARHARVAGPLGDLRRLRPRREAARYAQVVQR